MSFGTKPKRDHDLRKLLNALPGYLKAAIVEEVSARFPDFDKQLSNAAKAFVTWRYFYESEENKERKNYVVMPFAKNTNATST